MNSNDSTAPKKVKFGPAAKDKINIEPHNVRIASGLNQIEFWDKVGVTQSGGSRYENGERKVPKALAHIIRLTYIEHVDLKDVTRDNIEVAKLLLKDQPEVYNALLREVKMRRKL